jgi:choline transport protein
VAHMSEEIKDAAIIVPRSMVWSFLLNVPFTFGLLITYLFCIGNLEDAIASPTGFPFIYVFQNALGTIGGATALTTVVLILLIMITISSLASTSRQTFAFARDNGLPFSPWLAKVHPKWHIPVNSIIFTCLFTMTISLINIGSTVAFNAMLSLSTTALMGTYVISIGCVTLKRFRKETFPHAAWTLGRYGLTVNCIALTYAVWSFFWSFWPNAAAVTPQNFNWACVLFVGIIGSACILYYVHARKIYEGPVAKVQGRFGQ